MVDGGIEPAYVAFTFFAPQFHGFASGFWTMIVSLGEKERRDRVK